MRWTPWGAGRYSTVKTWCMHNRRTRECRVVDCVTRLELLATGFDWVTSHAVDWYT